MKLLITLATFISLVSSCLSAEIPKVPNFLLLADRYLLPQDGIILLRLYYDIPAAKFPAKFVLTPRVSVGKPEIYDPIKELWVDPAAPGVALPTLTSWYLVRLTRLTVPSAELCLSVLDTGAAVSYPSSCITLWNSELGRIYLRRINASLHAATVGKW